VSKSKVRCTVWAPYVTGLVARWNNTLPGNSTLKHETHVPCAEDSRD